MTLILTCKYIDYINMIEKEKSTMTKDEVTICNAVEACTNRYQEEDLFTLIGRSRCETEKEFLLKLIRVAMRYLIEIERKESQIEKIEKEKDSYQEEYYKCFKMYGKIYAESTKRKEDVSIVPTNKKIPYEVMICDAVEACTEGYPEKYLFILIGRSRCETEKEFLLKLIIVTMNYQFKIEIKKRQIEKIKKEKERYKEEYCKYSKISGKTYADDMKMRKKAGIYPADKNIPCEMIKRLLDLGMTRKEIGSELGISRSTVYRKLKEAKEKGFDNKEEGNW